MTTEYNSIPTTMSIYRKGDHPLFGESITKVELEDDAGGIFFTIKQDPNEFGPGGVLRLDFDEVDQLIGAINYLKDVAALVEKEMEHYKHGF